MGGSAGGGGSSGAVSWPVYIESGHQDIMLGSIDGDVGAGKFDDTFAFDGCLFSVIKGSRSGATGNPWSSSNRKTVYNPSTYVTTIQSRADEVKDARTTIFGTASSVGDNSLFASLLLGSKTNHGNHVERSKAWVAPTFTAEGDIDGGWVHPTSATALSRVSDAADDFGDWYDLQIANENIPKFQAGMANAGAALTSAYAIGLAMLQEGRNAAVAKFYSDAALQAVDSFDKAYYASLQAENTQKSAALLQEDQLKADSVRAQNVQLWAYEMQREQMIMSIFQALDKFRSMYFETTRVSANTYTELERINYLLQQEYYDKTQEQVTNYAEWELECFQYGANMLAAVQGGTRGTKTNAPKASPLAGALAGAAQGAMIGGMVGQPAIGAGIGALLGLGASLF